MSNCLIPYILRIHHKACIAGAESNEIPAPDEWSIYTHLFGLHATSPKQNSTPHVYF